ncbi:type IV pilin protein [Paucibacter sp. KBW04]|uniref:type IV pilin protein n=1 Tax=Paucibacter sp. KBW04 TaxID=2153361 RepID=UPI00267A2048|nr:type IV pilin protein [Paucibacter sp. KBW04]
MQSHRSTNALSGRRFQARHAGFTLIELMIAVVVIGILSAVALPSYQQYIKKSRAQSAGADLAALSLNLENRYQLQLRYPVIAEGAANSTSSFSAWSATQGEHFDYSVSSDASSYLLRAVGKGAMANCSLSLNHRNVRTVSSACGLTRW